MAKARETKLAGLVLVGSSLPASAQSLAWSMVPSPNRGSGSLLSGVSCVAADACTAVGTASYTARRYSEGTLIESWDGTSWSIVPSPDPGRYENALVGASCVLADACTAVGYYSHQSHPRHIKTLVESWDGTSWSVVPSPDPGPFSNYLSGVSCVSQTACTAVGSFESTSDLFGSFGLSGNRPIKTYLNEQKIPQLFIASGDDEWSDPKDFPWTMGWQPAFRAEGRIYANYIDAFYSGQKIAVLWQNDQFGRDLFSGLQEGLGDLSRMIVSDITFNISDKSIDSQIDVMCHKQTFRTSQMAKA